MKYEISIPMEDVVAGMVAAKPIFARNEHGVEVMLVKAETALTDSTIVRLHRYHVQNIIVFSETPPENPVSEEKTSEEILISNAAEEPLPKIKPVIDGKLQKDALQGIQNLFAVASGSSFTTAHQVVKHLDSIVDQLVETVSEETSGLVHISNLKSFDEYTFHHSLSVAVLSIAIGQGMNLDKADLKQLGRCAILHDIGKILVPNEIINKRGHLTDEEFEIIKSHSVKGAEYLKKENIGDKFLWDVVLSHHEKFDGTGYPNGLKGNEIPFFARIISVADVYDAITSHRSYREPMPPGVALEVIMGDAGRAFEYDIVSAFTKKVELYPIGSTLILSDKRTGVVINNRNSLRPVLRMLDNNQTINMAELANLHLVIEKVQDQDPGLFLAQFGV